MTYEEHIVSQQGMSPQPGNISEVKSVEVPWILKRERGGKKPVSNHAENSCWILDFLSSHNISHKFQLGRLELVS